MRVDILEIETESCFHSGVNVSKTNCKTMESFNIYENTQLKKAKYTVFLRNFENPIKIWNTQMNEKGVYNSVGPCVEIWAPVCTFW